MLETMSSIVLAEHLYGEVYEPATGNFGYTRVTAPNRKPYKTKDGYIGIMPYSDNQWNDFFELGGRGRLLEIDDRFTTYEARTSNINLLYEMVEEVAQQKSSDEWLTLLRERDIPAMPVNRLQDLKQDPHMQAVDFFQLFEHPTEGTYWNIKPPVKFSGSPSTIHRHPPKLGEHTQEVLSEAGIEGAVIEKILNKQKPKG
jgi:crotonobetainyl-CoA:carnitine CoA-transferase CaiB-like acyl-CoA transferase